MKRGNCKEQDKLALDMMMYPLGPWTCVALVRRYPAAARLCLVQIVFDDISGQRRDLIGGAFLGTVRGQLGVDPAVEPTADADPVAGVTLGDLQRDPTP